jgi:hypothetical protein
MEAELQALVGKYGFDELYNSLTVMMRREFMFLHSYFKSLPSEQRFFEAINSDTTVRTGSLVSTAPVAPVKAKKQRKQREKKTTEVVNEPSIVEPNTFVAMTDEIKEVIVTEKSGFRDPKEIKEYQKTQEEAKRRENEAAGIQLNAVLTKENLKQWVEVEGHTYAWVAREKAGCPETQVAATAQMMGIKSKISKKRGMIMTGK